MEYLECCGQFMNVVDTPGCVEMRCDRCGDVVFARKSVPLLQSNRR